MIEAFWKIRFVTESENGAGILVLENGLIRGGDSNYYYTGFYKVNDKVINAEVTVTHYFGHLNSVFGALTNVKMKLSAKVNDHSFTLSGEAVDLGQAVNIKIERIGELTP